MKARNYYVYGAEDYLKNLRDEYVWIGRAVRLEEGRLVVLAYQPKVKKEEKKGRR